MARRVSHLPKRRLLEDYATAGTRAVSSVVLVDWFSLVDGVVADLSPDERRWIEHRTAANVYRLGGVDD